MPNPSDRRQAGQAAEALARRHLEQQGLRLIETNYHCRTGEIDLIMEDRGAIVFIEVRLRNNPAFGSGAESVDWRKQGKLTATAQHYLQRHPRWAEQPARFDVISISGQGPEGQIEWITNAFQA